jgi:GNAT superfamily N-acetyltransferase
MTDKPRISPMAAADINELVRLHEMYLNFGEGVRAHFAQVLADPASVAVKCEAQGRMIGLDIYTRGIALSGGHEELCARVRTLAGEATVYTGDALLVVPAWRGKGVSALMLAESRRLLAARGAVYVLYELWVHPDGQMPARHTVGQYADVTDLGLHEHFYVDFDHYGYYCPICGDKCRCGAHLYLCRV